MKDEKSKKKAKEEKKKLDKRVKKLKEDIKACGIDLKEQCDISNGLKKEMDALKEMKIRHREDEDEKKDLRMLEEKIKDKKGTKRAELKKKLKNDIKRKKKAWRTERNARYPVELDHLEKKINEWKEEGKYNRRGLDGIESRLKRSLKKVDAEKQRIHGVGERLEEKIIAEVKKFNKSLKKIDKSTQKKVEVCYNAIGEEAEAVIRYRVVLSDSEREALIGRQISVIATTKVKYVKNKEALADLEERREEIKVDLKEVKVRLTKLGGSREAKAKVSEEESDSEESGSEEESDSEESGLEEESDSDSSESEEAKPKKGAKSKSKKSKKKSEKSSKVRSKKKQQFSSDTTASSD